MASISVFSFNLRVDNSGDGRNAFSAERKGFVESVFFKKYMPDLVGFQETAPHMRQWLVDILPEYDVVGVGRGADLLGESNVIAYRRERFMLVTADTFWLSDTPRVPGSRFSTDQSSCPRICTCAMLMDKTDGKLFRYYNTHLDHRGNLAKIQGITIILNRMARDYGEWAMPVLLTGDFNVTPDSPVYHSCLSFSGCGKPLQDCTAEIGATFHNYKGETQQGIKIDYIFTTMPFDSTKSVKAMDTENGIYLSDHYPIGTEVHL